MDEATTKRLNDLLLDHHHTLLQPTSTQYADFISLAKHYLDPLAGDITEAQLEAEKKARQSRKRKRKVNDDGRDEKTALRMRKIFVDGMSVEQVWQQAKRILEAAADEVEKSLPQIGEPVEEDEVVINGTSKGNKSVRFLDDGLDIRESDEDEDESEEDVGLEEDGGDSQGDEDVYSEQDLRNGDKATDSDDESLELDEDTPVSDISEEENKRSGKTYIKDPNGLNDGFFSIDDFNKNTQFLEHQDARGDPNDGAASDEEDIDWDANPLSMSLPAQAGKAAKSRGPKSGNSKQRRHRGDSDDESEDEEEGPTFGNMNLNAPEGDSEEEIEDDDIMGVDDLGNTNDIHYADFFAPPPKKAGKNKKSKTRKAFKPHSSSKEVGMNGVSDLAKEPAGSDEDEEEEMQRAMSAVQRDLFEDEEDYDESEEDMVDENGSRVRGNLSTHERRQLAFREEIRRLEAENVAAKPWSMTGETIAPVRPMNSLLEEDLDFERAGKPVPVITEDVSESIEELIKRRILARDFDEVIRRRGGAGDMTVRRGRALEEVSDSKPTKGLAEEYEQDHLRRTDPNYVDSRSEALKASHTAIETQWANISAQLDALSHYHFKPRPPAVSVEIRVDAPTISMEEARPGATAATAGAAMLAPQEVYRPGDEKAGQGEIRTTGGAVLAKEEMSRENKQRRRRREKERAKKKKDTASLSASNADTKKEKDKEVIGQLKKGGVKAIDKKSGSIRNADGTVHSGQNVANLTGGSLKL